MGLLIGVACHKGFHENRFEGPSPAPSTKERFNGVVTITSVPRQTGTVGHPMNSVLTESLAKLTSW